jgi:hypothetical protein
MSDRESVAGGQSGAPVGDLSVLMQGTRAEVTAYLAKARARQRRLLNVALVAGALATAFAAVPALGGKPLSDFLDEKLGLSAPAWQVLCILAAICSLATAIVTQMQKSQNLEENLARAETVRARLEILNIGLITGNLTREQAANEYGECLKLATFL